MSVSECVRVRVGERERGRVCLWERREGERGGGEGDMEGARKRDRKADSERQTETERLGGTVKRAEITGQQGI